MIRGRGGGIRKKKKKRSISEKTRVTVSKARELNHLED